MKFHLRFSTKGVWGRNCPFCLLKEWFFFIMWIKRIRLHWSFEYSLLQFLIEFFIVTWVFGISFPQKWRTDCKYFLEKFWIFFFNFFSRNFFYPKKIKRKMFFWGQCHFFKKKREKLEIISHFWFFGKKTVPGHFPRPHNIFSSFRRKIHETKLWAISESQINLLLNLF